MSRAGIRAHDIGLYSPQELPRKLAEAGVHYVQLTLEDAFPQQAPAPYGLNAGYAARMRRLFAQNGVDIAVLSCYINPVHPDADVRRAQLEKFCHYVHYARDFGCGVVATETGSLLPDLSFAPQNYGPETMEMLLESLQKMVDAAQRCGVTVAMEGVHKFVAHDPQSIAYILEQIPSQHLQVVLDPVNLLTRGDRAQAQALAGESFARYGSRIAVVHAKDIAHTPDKRPRPAPVGQGALDWRWLAALCASHKPWIPVILEETSPGTLPAELSALDEAFATCGESKEKGACV